MESFDEPYVFAHGDVWLGDPSLGRHVCDGSQEMAIAYDREDGTLHKHGNAARVQEWARERRKVLSDFGAHEMAATLEVVTFPACQETVTETNACMAVTGRVLRLPERLEAIAMKRPDLVSRPRYPD